MPEDTIIPFEQMLPELFKDTTPEPPKTPEDAWARLNNVNIGDFYSNALRSGLSQIGNVARGVGSMVSGGANLIMHGQIPQALQDPKNQVIRPMIESYKRRYADIPTALSTLYEDPFGAVNDVATLTAPFTAAGKLGLKAAGMEGKLASTLGKVEAATTPLSPRTIGKVTEPLRESLSQKLYGHSIGELPKNMEAQRPAMAKIGVETGTPIGKLPFQSFNRNLKGLNLRLEDVMKQVEDRVAAIESAGGKIDQATIAKEIDDVKKNWKGMQESDAENIINAALKKFIDKNPESQIRPTRGQEFKQDTYRAIEKYYKERATQDPAKIEAEKAGARGAKKELERLDTELANKPRNPVQPVTPSEPTEIGPKSAAESAKVFEKAIGSPISDAEESAKVLKRAQMRDARGRMKSYQETDNPTPPVEPPERLSSTGLENYQGNIGQPFTPDRSYGISPVEKRVAEQLGPAASTIPPQVLGIRREPAFPKGEGLVAAPGSTGYPPDFFSQNPGVVPPEMTRENLIRQIQAGYGQSQAPVGPTVRNGGRPLSEMNREAGNIQELQNVAEGHGAINFDYPVVQALHGSTGLAATHAAMRAAPMLESRLALLMNPRKRLAPRFQKLYGEGQQFMFPYLARDEESQ